MPPSEKMDQSSKKWVSCHTTQHWKKGPISFHTRTSGLVLTILEQWFCCQGLFWQTECCPEYTELLLCCFSAVDFHLISCFRQTLELDSVGTCTCKWYLQGFGLEYCQSEWAWKRVWEVVWVCVCTVHVFMSVLVLTWKVWVYTAHVLISVLVYLYIIYMVSTSVEFKIWIL